MLTLLWARFAQLRDGPQGLAISEAEQSQGLIVGKKYHPLPAVFI
ncbi:MAG: hypothetical protein AAGA31_07045 [Bacteroidota bacterium]